MGLKFAQVFKKGGEIFWRSLLLTLQNKVTDAYNVFVIHTQHKGRSDCVGV